MNDVFGGNWELLVQCGKGGDTQSVSCCSLAHGEEGLSPSNRILLPPPSCRSIRYRTHTRTLNLVQPDPDLLGVLHRQKIECVSILSKVIRNLMQVRIQTPKMSIIHPLHAKNFHFFLLVYTKTTKHFPPVCYGVGRMREFSSKSPDQISF